MSIKKHEDKYGYIKKINLGFIFLIIYVISTGASLFLIIHLIDRSKPIWIIPSIIILLGLGYGWVAYADKNSPIDKKT